MCWTSENFTHVFPESLSAGLTPIQRVFLELWLLASTLRVVVHDAVLHGPRALFMFLRVLEEGDLERQVKGFLVSVPTHLVRSTAPGVVVALMQHRDVREVDLEVSVYVGEEVVHGDHPGLRHLTLELRDIREVVIVLLEFLLVLVLPQHCHSDRHGKY